MCNEPWILTLGSCDIDVNVFEENLFIQTFSIWPNTGKFSENIHGSLLKKTAAGIRTDKSVWFWFLNITSPLDFAPPSHYHSLPTPRPLHRTHSPNLQLLLVIVKIRYCLKNEQERLTDSFFK